MISKLCLLLWTLATICDGANILYVIPFSAMSHYINLRPIGLELARRGHNVTVITTHKEKNPPTSYHEVKVDDKSVWELLGGERPNVFTMVELSAEEFHKEVLWKGSIAFVEWTLNSSEVQTFLKKDSKFDLVIAEQLFQEATYLLAHKYNAPLALITTYGNCMKHNIVTRNPLQLSTILFEYLDVKYPSSFWGRLRNLYFSMYEYFWWRFWYVGKQEEIAKKYIPGLKEPVPSIYELQRNVSLMLYNSHFSFDNAVAYTPNIIEIGGAHLSKSDGTLPNDLKKILDDAKHGVVYVNFGSNVQSSELPLDKKNAFIEVFRELKQTVIWKWEDDDLGNKPNNLFIRKWMPQNEVLAHPNIKMFISHGGLLGTQEAIFHGIPILGIPVYADQYNNLLQVEEIGFGRLLEFKDINEDNLRRMLNDILTDDKYRDKAKEVSARFKDRPMSALDTAMFWIEYVIRNKGAPYMKNAALNLDFIASNMLDVYAFILLVLSAILFVFIKIVNVLRNLIVGSTQVKKTTSVKAKKVKQKQN